VVRNSLVSIRRRLLKPLTKVIRTIEKGKTLKTLNRFYMKIRIDKKKKLVKEINTLLLR